MANLKIGGLYCWKHSRKMVIMPILPLGTYVHVRNEYGMVLEVKTVSQNILESSIEEYYEEAIPNE